MPIEVGLWRIGAKLERVKPSSLALEKSLEDHIVADPSILAPGLLVLGRQVLTAHGTYVDVIAVDATGKLVVVELKRDRTPREVVAQVLDYGSWVQALGYEELKAIYEPQHPGEKLEEALAEAFGENPPETLNESHELIVVASQLDPSTERIIGYLSESFGVPINAVFFQCYRDGDREYLARTWLIDPDEAEAKAAKKTRKGSEPWNGRDFYVSLGDGERRSWDDCRKYGFVSGGGGRWYSQTLAMLEPGKRVFVNIPGTGYVGVGVVRSAVVPVTEFTVDVGGKQTPILEAPLKAPKMNENVDDLERCEHVVGVDWLKAVARSEAYWEKGFFALQHTACRLKSQFTIDRVSKHFGIEE